MTKQDIWVAVKVVLLIGVVASSVRPAKGVTDLAAPVLVDIFIAGLSLAIFAALTPFILRQFPSTSRVLGTSVWRACPIWPVSFAHFVAWSGLAFSAGLIIQLFHGAPITDDLLIPLSANLGAGIGLLAGIARLRRANREANQQIQPIAGKPGSG